MRNQGALAWYRGIAGTLLPLTLAAAARSEVPSLPNLVPVPPSNEAPLSSAQRPGTEYSDLAKAGYVKEEYGAQGESRSAIYASCELVTGATRARRSLIKWMCPS